ncbi:MAG: radical SAM protein [Saprospiraceae bacterium]|nr:radical SAM protein [Saprospiraceae bacterium]
MQPTVFLITPPFTQLNTPYPATAYLKGFLNTRQIGARQADLGIEVILALFSKRGLTQLFAQIDASAADFSDNARRILALQDDYIHSIDAVIGFLQGKNPTLSHLICQDGFLPEAGRFDQLDDLDWAFGSLGTQDKAKHLATLYLEDLSDLIQECVDPHFGFSRYAERLGRSANQFDELYEALQQDYTYIDQLLIDTLETRMAGIQPALVAISVPFPGNLYAAFRCAQWIKKHCPGVKTAMGGGFANTELRSLSEPRVFEFFDFITLDDGEAPIEHLIEHVTGKRPVELLKRTFALIDGKVEYLNHSLNKDYKQADTGTPDYSDLWLDQYISVLEIANPMHRMWSDGRWNKLTMAHGCYWGKCTFCDISLDYIKIYEPLTAQLLCDRMETVIAQTGQNGFHFVDEAAPPALMRALALEIIRRKLTVSWWTNIRFEKSFTRDLCRLLRASGCVAVSGGLEVASDRLLELIQKGVTVAQVARVTRNFTESGIMVHAYLMYGFPTQTAQETIDSLEMVRQMFEAGILQSGFWHQFAMTAHSPVGMYPAQFGVKKQTEQIGRFANNDLVHIDPTGADHDVFSYGLKKSLLNFMHGIGLDFPLHDWFEFKVPRTGVPKNYIAEALGEAEPFSLKPTAKIVWLGAAPTMTTFTKTKKGTQWDMATLTFQDKRETFGINTLRAQGEWLVQILQKMSVVHTELFTFQQVKADYEAAGLDDFELFWYGKPVNTLRNFGLLAP